MNIEAYSFNEFKMIAAAFHGYPSPGIMIGAGMVVMARKGLPENTLFEAISETGKCLPDAIQLLTPCTLGNNRLKVVNLGKYALSLVDKYTGKGVRVSVDAEKMRAFPEIYGWFFKEKAKKEQDTECLLAEIESAGEGIFVLRPVQLRPALLGHKHMRGVAVCPRCHEPYPVEDGDICRGCAGASPYLASC